MDVSPPLMECILDGINVRKAKKLPIRVRKVTPLEGLMLVVCTLDKLSASPQGFQVHSICFYLFLTIEIMAALICALHHDIIIIIRRKCCGQDHAEI